MLQDLPRLVVARAALGDISSKLLEYSFGTFDVPVQALDEGLSENSRPKLIRLDGLSVPKTDGHLLQRELVASAHAGLVNLLRLVSRFVGAHR